MAAGEPSEPPAGERRLLSSRPGGRLSSDVRGLLGDAAPRDEENRRGDAEFVIDPTFYSGSTPRHARARLHDTLDSRLERLEARPRLARQGAFSPGERGAEAGVWAGAFGLGALRKVVAGLEARDESLEWGVDVNAVRLRGGRKEVVNGGVPADGLPAAADAEDAPGPGFKELERLYREEGCTLQVHQPQRWNDRLWRACAVLEEHQGCLTGCNAYITPPGQQGLAPHFDDVDVWVCQTEGSKHWRVYSQVGLGLRDPEGPAVNPEALEAEALPPDPPSALQRPQQGHRPAAVAQATSSLGHLLAPLADIWATCSSGDLAPEQFAESGVELLMEVTLQVGDVLYIPRGCVHEARAASGADGGSCHVTISTHQRWCLGEALRQGFGRAMATAYMRMPLALRWPLQSQRNQDGSRNRREMACLAAQGLREMADELERRPGADELTISTRPGRTRTVLDLGIQEMRNDFMASRLPPHPSQLPSFWYEPLGFDDVVAPIRHGLVDFHTFGRPHEPYAEDVPEELTIRIASCRGNLRETHMMGGGGELLDAGGAECDGAGEGGEEADKDAEGGEEDDEDPEGAEAAEEAGFGLVEVPATEREAVERVFLKAHTRRTGTPDGIRVRDVYPGRPELGLTFCKMLFQHGLINTVARGREEPRGARAKNDQGAQQGAGSAPADRPSKRARK